MNDRPLTDYLINLLEDQALNSASSLILPENTVILTDEIMEENAREFAEALNSLLGRNAIGEKDILCLIEKAKKEAGLK